MDTLTAQKTVVRSKDKMNWTTRDQKATSTAMEDIYGHQLVEVEITHRGTSGTKVGGQGVRLAGLCQEGLLLERGQSWGEFS